jgi:hypothetical protein
MKHIRTNIDHTIQMISDKEFPNTSTYSGEFPDDFYSTFSKGKYLFQSGEIIENPNWNESNGEILSLPDKVPHRALLIEAGVSSLQELLTIDDLTSLTGIGEAKAKDINEYLSTKNNEV